MAAPLMKVDGKSVADRIVIIDAARLALLDVYETVIASIENPDDFKKLGQDPMVDRQAYLTRGIRFDRWPSGAAKSEKPAATLRAVGLCASPRKYGNTLLLILWSDSKASRTPLIESNDSLKHHPKGLAF
jgi:hypothetical protein